MPWQRVKTPESALEAVGDAGDPQRPKHPAPRPTQG